MLQVCQCGFQGFDRYEAIHRSRSGTRHGTQVETEPVVGQVETSEQLQVPGGDVESGDLCNHQCDSGLVSEIPEVDLHLIALIETCDQPWHHARIQRCAGPAHQGDQALGAFLRTHGPPAQQQGVAVASSRQQETTHSRWP
mgnify:CR=1 FL=1